jgi:hypothetical protein
VRKTEIQDLSTQVRLTVWVSLNSAAPITSMKGCIPKELAREHHKRGIFTKRKPRPTVRSRGYIYRGKGENQTLV